MVGLCALNCPKTQIHRRSRGSLGVRSACSPVWDFLLGKACLKKKKSEIACIQFCQLYLSEKTHYGDGCTVQNTLKITDLCALNR